MRKGIGGVSGILVRVIGTIYQNSGPLPLAVKSITVRVGHGADGSHLLDKARCRSSFIRGTRQDDGSWESPDGQHGANRGYPSRNRRLLCNQENRSRWKQTQALRQKRLPPLPVDDYKVVIRPRDGLNFSAWTTDKITQAIIAMAQLSAAEMAQATKRIRRDQNLVVVSTPNMESSTRVQQISALTLGTKQYEVTAYLAVPDNSCRGVISGVETRPTAEELTENLRATGINILYARMMGQTNTAVITFEGIRVPRFVYLSGGEYPCRPYQPRQQVCGVCLHSKKKWRKKVATARLPPFY
ncbi:hypothetical protein HPB47_013742 [Ixodes persulcatus]|uniref:Uncharacterized protein n=1 Tax=Ixodes persulcatus TaxID=34615 RepID=A0AC60QXR2_IXOPE|nr:hypothetical protein HPB47_013742 [Ixodes persulcatus]